jgi:lipopolysaccharide transport system permease protein
LKLIVEPGRRAKNYWHDLWQYRELMYFLAWRDITVRYKQTVIGIAWAVLRPGLTMLAFLGFRRLAGLPPGQIPDAILVSAAVLPWQFFSTALTDTAGSVIGNSHLISKVYFPRLILPCSAIASALVDFLITLCLFIILMLAYGLVPRWQMVGLPLFLMLAVGLSLGLGLLFAALNVEYRDVRYIVPFCVQFGMFLSPIAFSSSEIPDKWRLLYSLNPMVAVIDGFRWSVSGGATSLDLITVAPAVLITVILILIGITYFRRVERSFADVI